MAAPFSVFLWLPNKREEARSCWLSQPSGLFSCFHDNVLIACLARGSAGWLLLGPSGALLFFILLEIKNKYLQRALCFPPSLPVRNGVYHICAQRPGEQLSPLHSFSVQLGGAGDTNSLLASTEDGCCFLPQDPHLPLLNPAKQTGAGTSQGAESCRRGIWTLPGISRCTEEH